MQVKTVEDFRAFGNIPFDKTIDQVVLVHFQVADRRIWIADVIGLERQAAEEIEMRQLGVGKAGDVARVRPRGVDHGSAKIKGMF